MRLPKILIVEDEPEMILGLRDNFEYQGYEVVVACDGLQAVESALSELPDLILLDVMLPKLNGFDVCRRLRRAGLITPIIMLTARGQETDKIVGLEIGADDYVTKPFSIKELLARVGAMLRRAEVNNASVKPAPPAAVYRFGDIEIDFKNYRAAKSEEPLALSPREFEILKYFVKRRGEAITREELLDRIWGYDNYPFTRTVDNHIAKLRQKIEDSPAEPQYIITLHRIGYKFLG